MLLCVMDINLDTENELSLPAGSSSVTMICPVQGAEVPNDDIRIVQ